MNILLVILLVVIALIGIFLIAALFVSRDYAIRRHISIERPLDEVFDYVRHLKNQKHYNKWVMMERNMKADFRGVDGTVGFVFAWDGDGKGEQEITNVVEGQRVDIEIRFERPFKSTARVPIVVERVAANETKVTWAMEGKSNYPLNLITAMMSGTLGKDLDVSLRNLKNVLERSQDGRDSHG